jgi:hypothetical protein
VCSPVEGLIIVDSLPLKYSCTKPPVADVFMTIYAEAVRGAVRKLLGPECLLGDSLDCGWICLGGEVTVKRIGER